jgi:gamma-glutamyltranspeptidase/glutathione hydrolase
MVTSLIIALLLVPLLRNGNPLTPYYACEGMVVSAHPLATEAGLAVLRAGGNAFDAGVATEFALAVVFPVAGNIGGGGFAIIHTADGEINSLDYREQAPAAASSTMYLDSAGNPIPKRSTHGLQAAGIPGTVAGMYALHQQYGRMAWDSLLLPAITYARHGWPLTEKEAALLNSHHKELEKYNGKHSYLTHKHHVKAGELLLNPQLAKTLELIAENGKAGFYSGPVADSLVAQMSAGGGYITQQDLTDYQAIWRPTLHFDYGDYTIHSMGPPSSGGVLLSQIWQMTHNYPIDRWDPNDMRSLQLVIEAERRAYADRSAYLGDPDFVTIPVAALTDSVYLAKRIANIRWEYAGKSTQTLPGTVYQESDQTTHYCVADGAGNLMTATTSLNGAYGSKVIVSGAGFLLNNTMDDFSIAPGIPNSYGLVGSAANAIAPGKRMLSSMTPTLVLQKGKPYLITGTPGGSTIPTTVFQVLMHVLDYDKNIQAAVSSPRFHHQWLPDEVKFELGRFNKRMLRDLKERGYVLKPSSPYGRAEGIRILPDATLEGGADPRGDDKVGGF